MMDIKDKQLLVFGYGISALIPSIILLHILKPGALIAVAVLIALLVLLSYIHRTRWLVIGWFFLAFFGIWKQGVDHLGVISSVFFVLSLIFLGVTLSKPERLQPVYKLWMKLVGFIGTVISGILLSVVFYVVFGISGIVLRIMRKDLLDEKLEPEKASYWIKRQPGEFDKESYTKQF